MIEISQKEDFTQLVEIWESAVKHTHHFLKVEDFEFYKSQIPFYFTQVQLYVYREDSGEIKGFLGVDGTMIEMLFVSQPYRGTGVGSQLLQFALNSLGADKVDVNEENKQALGFYTHWGFKRIGRSAVDGAGKNYPILHLQLEP